jgi:hypothetical protein
MVCILEHTQKGQVQTHETSKQTFLPSFGEGINNKLE